ncbi:MAG: FCD domain-containing protein [Actinomycetota bacterium]|nr:FCD domain-containing protein [Actinomycetota bacterium]
MSSGRDGGRTASAAATWELRLDARRPLPEVIEEKLRDLIDRGEFPPGQQLPNEPELARRMEVARSSVRTALQRLEVQRVVEVKRGRGWFVRRKPVTDPEGDFVGWISERRFRVGELLEVRMALEGLAASLAAARATDGELDDIAKLSSDHRGAHNGDVDELARTDEAFHAAIVKASGNELLIATYRMLVGDLAEFRRRSFTVRETIARSATGHDTVVMFLKRRDSAGARTAMVSHLLALYQEVQSVEYADAPGEPAQLTTFVGVENEPEWPQR